MADQKLCGPCQKVLSDDLTLQWRRYRVHHPDAESFEKALQLSCQLCSLMWGVENGFERPSMTVPGKTLSKVFQTPDEKRTVILQFILGTRDYTVTVVPCEGVHFPFLFTSKTDLSIGDMPPSSCLGLLSANTRAASATNFLLDKYQECCTHHTDCRLMQSDIQRYPTRLIAVGLEADTHVRLCDTNNFIDEGPYFCLSHCWGKVQPYVLNKTTEPLLRNGIDINDLPRTFQDAISVTRLFRIRYLWIDSLCIFQDSVEDWSIEAKSMLDVYSRAAATIAATGALDHSEGLFFDRYPAFQHPVRLEASWSSNLVQGKYRTEIGDRLRPGIYWFCLQHIWNQSIETATLNNRAWVAQERHLSRRTFHFAKNELFWECGQLRASERYPKGLPQWALPRWSENPTILKQDLDKLKLLKLYERSHSVKPASFDLHSLYYSWSIFLIQYSVAAMTREADKLVAIQGVAQDVGYMLNDRLVAGLWETRLPEELCWLRHELMSDPLPRELLAWRAPTWSWASTEGRCWVSTTTKFHRKCPGKEIWPKVDSLDVETKPSGELIHASLGLRCKPFSVELDTYKDSDYGRDVTHIFGNEGMDLVFDSGGPRLSFDDRRLVPRQLRAFLVIIQRCAHEDEDEDENIEKDEDGTVSYFTKFTKKDVVEGLILVPNPDSLNLFERLGTFQIEGNDQVEKTLAEHRAAETRVITLI